MAGLTGLAIASDIDVDRSCNCGINGFLSLSVGLLLGLPFTFTVPAFETKTEDFWADFERLTAGLGLSTLEPGREMLDVVIDVLEIPTLDCKVKFVGLGVYVLFITCSTSMYLGWLRSY